MPKKKPSAETHPIDIGRCTPGLKLPLHKVHIGRHMIEKSTITLTQVIQSRLTLSRRGEAVAGTLAVAGKQPPAITALLGQRTELAGSNSS